MFLELQNDTQWDEIYQIRNSKEQNDFHYRELQLIYRQTCLLKGISEDIKLKSKQSQKTVPTESSLDDQPNVLVFSDRSLKMTRSTRNIKQNYPDWMRLNYDETQLRQALAQVKQHCSELTFQILEKICLFRINESPNFRKFIEKEIKSNQQLKAKWLKVYQQNLNLKNQIETKDSIISKMEEQKSKIKKYEQNLMEKQKNFIKLQGVLINREKMGKETRKYLEWQTQIITQSKKTLQDLKEQINMSLEDNQKIQECTGKCWRKDLYINCKNSLLKQKQLLQEEQKLIQKHYINTNLFVDEIIQALHIKTI